MSTIVDELPANNDFSGRNRQKPWLLPSNRKLRHLQGIAVRNLIVTPPPAGRARGNTLDDQNIPNELQTPAKALAKREIRTIHHSRSTTDLTRPQSPPDLKLARGDNERERKKGRSMARRRSTLTWAGASPGVRQTQLEDVAGSRMADSWFSIHCAGISEPVYVSEVIEKAMNPSFKYFDLDVCGPAVSRLDKATVKFWARTSCVPEYFLLLEHQVSFRSLQYIGKTLENFHHPLPPNCIVFHFTDGVYTSLIDLPAKEPPSASISRGFESHRDNQQPTSSYDALMRLSNLDDCIQDASNTRSNLEIQINTILEENRAHIELLDRKSQAKERLSLIKRAVVGEKTRLRQSLTQRDNILESLEARRNAMAEGRLHQNNTQTYLSETQEAKTSSQILLKKTTEDSMGQIRRICEDLLLAYPIEPIAGKALAFTIRGLALPNSCFDDIDKESVAGALGYTAQLVHLLSCYLSVPLPYPVRPYLSNSFIKDPISIGLALRSFPLCPVNAHYQFEYGVFLLNKDIEYLMNRLGLRVLDIRQTLPNLKYLTYMLTAGTSELPARKAGGVRGLFSAGAVTPSLSRQESKDSMVSGDTIMFSRNKLFPFHQPSMFTSTSTSTNGGMPRNPGVGGDQVSVNMTAAIPVIVNNERNINNDDTLAHAGQGGIQSPV